ncbi:30S ribosomal protein S4 [Methanosarcinales archaeon]|nr:MAG: 30S ribosomal protein S4 [Methanosarcinales archaeon]
MGYPGKNRKTYETPKHPWEESRLVEEAELIKKYGLRNKREVWKAYTVLVNYRRLARNLMARIAMVGETPTVKREIENLLNKLKRYGLVKDDAELSDVLSLSVEDILERRLQTQVFRQGLAKSIKQARQFIVHGHIAVKGRKVTVPSYLVPVEEEMEISYYVGSPLSTPSHPERKLIESTS